MQKPCADFLEYCQAVGVGKTHPATCQDFSGPLPTVCLPFPPPLLPFLNKDVYSSYPMLALPWHVNYWRRVIVFLVHRSSDQEE